MFYALFSVMYALTNQDPLTEFLEIKLQPTSPIDAPSYYKSLVIVLSGNHC